MKVRKNICCVYLIICFGNGGFYIGSSVDWRNRKTKHKRELKKNEHYNSRLQRSWNKYSENMFGFLILEMCDRDKRQQREQHYLDLYFDNTQCFNAARNVNGFRLGYVMSDETKRKIGDANKKSLKGKKLTEEHKLNVKNALIERYKTIQMPSPDEETRMKMRLAKLGKPAPHNSYPRTEETKRKISESKKGHKWSEETRKKHEERHRKNRES